MIEQIFAIRGATTASANEKSCIEKATIELMQEILIKNNFANNKRLEISDIIISTTSDLTAYYPATALRQSKLVDVPLFSAIEPNVENSLPLCIRLLVRVANYGERQIPKHVYLHEAITLRPDLISKE